MSLLERERIVQVHGEVLIANPVERRERVYFGAVQLLPGGWRPRPAIGALIFVIRVVVESPIRCEDESSSPKSTRRSTEWVRVVANSRQDLSSVVASVELSETHVSYVSFR